MMLLVVACAVAACLAALATAMAVKEWGLVAAASVGAVLSASPAQLVLDRKGDREHLPDGWVDVIDHEKSLITRAAS